ncbi:MAG: alpha/beta fold hydrolase [Deltaproteobacteria bacterium]|nr:MAG: alpha/beta fold hydrolase [Deltaproteobacteria bacterium]
MRAVEIPATADAPRLAGEVLVPHGKGPHPAVLFLSGAGRQDRYGFSEPPPVDARTHVWTDALARAGFAVLRFDDRGTGGSADGRLDFRAEAEDARRALGTLLVQDDVDPRRVTVVGHGEGGWHALFLARSDPSIRAVVLVGTPGRRYDRIVRHQSEVALAGLPPEARAESLGELDAILAGLRRPRAETVGGKVAEEPEDTAYLRQILAVDPGRLFRGVCAKVLVVQGGADFEVDPKADPAALVAAARAAGVDVAQATYPHVDHHLVRIDGPGRPQRYLDRQRPVHMPAVDRMATFLAEAVAADDAPGTCPRGVRGDDTAVQSTSRPVR